VLAECLLPDLESETTVFRATKRRKRRKLKFSLQYYIGVMSFLFSDICHSRHSGMPLGLITRVKKVKGFSRRDILESEWTCVLSIKTRHAEA